MKSPSTVPYLVVAICVVYRIIKIVFPILQLIVIQQMWHNCDTTCFDVLPQIILLGF